MDFTIFSLDNFVLIFITFFSESWLKSQQTHQKVLFR